MTEAEWEGDNDKKKNPHLLFDTVPNLSNGGGTLNVAASWLRWLFAKLNPGKDLNPNFTTDEELLRSFTTTFQGYNPRETGYGVSVMKLRKAHQPVQGGGIFQ